MEKSEKVKKGSEVVALRMRVKGYGDEAFDLMKIPVEALYREALCEVGEQKSYIEELEATVNQLKKEINEQRNASLLDKSERVAIAKEVKKEELYNNQRQMMKSYREEIRAYKKRADELLCKLLAAERTIRELKGRLGGSVE